MKIHVDRKPADVYLSGEDTRFYKRGICQYPARLSGGFQSPTEINASGGSQPRKEEGASHLARRGKNPEAFLNMKECIVKHWEINRKKEM